MNTTTMVSIANQNDKTYKCKLGTYSKEDGFLFVDSIYDIYETPEEVADALFDANNHNTDWQIDDTVKELSFDQILDAAQEHLNCKIKLKSDDHVKSNADFYKQILDLLH